MKNQYECRSGEKQKIKATDECAAQSNVKVNHVLPFCLGMLVTYYVVAALSHGVYSKVFIIGWTVFALCSPVMAYFAWLTKRTRNLPENH